MMYGESADDLRSEGADPALPSKLRATMGTQCPICPQFRSVGQTGGAPVR